MGKGVMSTVLGEAGCTNNTNTAVASHYRLFFSCSPNSPWWVFGRGPTTQRIRKPGSLYLGSPPCKPCTYRKLEEDRKRERE